MINWELESIYREALESEKSIVISKSKSQAILSKGVKIEKFLDRIEIFNVAKGGDYGRECTLEEYDFFYTNGWELGVLQVALNNCLHKLDIIEVNIKTEVNTRKNDKHIQNLKSSREKIMNKYTINKKKFNQLKSKQNGELF
jgi:hypothetical protein